MALSKSEIEQYIKESFPQASFELVDLAGDNNHWSLNISCNSFVGLNRIQQHRAVYDALKGKMGNELHALQIKTTIKL